MSEDDQLMIRLQGGDHLAFETLVERYQGPLFGFFCRNTHDPQFSEDLTQETLLRVYNQSWDFLPSGRFKAWMYRIARNLLIDNIRRQSHDALIKAVRGHGPDEADAMARLADDLLAPDERAGHREFAALVERLLEQIPHDQRLTFTLHHFAGLSLPEVSEVMETNVATSKSRLRLAREKLREHLRQHGITDPNDHER